MRLASLEQRLTIFPLNSFEKVPSSAFIPSAPEHAIHEIAKEQKRWVKMVCAFPFSPATRNRRGINKTHWIRIDRVTYDACLDRRDYSPKEA